MLLLLLLLLPCCCCILGIDGGWPKRLFGLYGCCSDGEWARARRSVAHSVRGPALRINRPHGTIYFANRASKYVNWLSTPFRLRFLSGVDGASIRSPSPKSNTSLVHIKNIYECTVYLYMFGTAGMTRSLLALWAFPVMPSCSYGAMESRLHAVYGWERDKYALIVDVVAIVVVVGDRGVGRCSPTIIIVQCVYSISLHVYWSAHRTHHNSQQYSTQI